MNKLVCPLPVNKQGVIHVVALLATCMIDQNLVALTSAIERLTISTDRLAEEIRHLRINAPSGSAQEVVVTLAVVEGSRVPFRLEFTNHCALLAHIPAEDGLPEVPEFALLSCVEKLSGSKAPGPAERAKTAYRAGFWASVAIRTSTAYNQVQAQGLKNNRWVVLQCSNHDPFRVTTRRDFEKLISLTDPQLVFAVFDSIAELEVFCLGASAVVPPLQRC